MHIGVYCRDVGAYYHHPPADKPIETAKKRKNIIAIYRYLISKDPSLLTAEAASSVFKFDDEELNEEVIRILKTNQSPVLYELYHYILGTEQTLHSFVAPVTSSRSSGSCQFLLLESYITGKKMNIKDHYQEWYNLAKLD